MKWAWGHPSLEMLNSLAMENREEISLLVECCSDVLRSNANKSCVSRNTVVKWHWKSCKQGLPGSSTPVWRAVTHWLVIQIIQYTLPLCRWDPPSFSNSRYSCRSCYFACFDIEWRPTSISCSFLSIEMLYVFPGVYPGAAKNES